MLGENSHIADQQLLLAADGELSARSAAQVRAHLAACWHCRARMSEIQQGIADFARVHRQTLDPQLPPVAGSRALLGARMAELSIKSDIGSWRRFFQLRSIVNAPALICVAILFAALIGKWSVRPESHATDLAVAAFDRSAEPDPSLTPGRARPISVAESCAMPHEQVIREVPAALRNKILQQYGIANARAAEYEIDYLIAPGLGGEEDIQNLWPEPYTAATWNAHVKDALEEQLHQMVCAGTLDLPTAQRDIATDWIAAYKKYFRTDTPHALGSDRWPAYSFASFHFQTPHSGV
jgi:hypothetical protein